jgi:AcrR family transcriptional regulator
VLSGAIEPADRIGIEPFTIRKLAAELDVKPMTTYHYVAKKAILDGMIDIVFSEIDLPPADVDWKTAVRRRSLSARFVLSPAARAPTRLQLRSLVRVRPRPPPRWARGAAGGGRLNGFAFFGTAATGQACVASVRSTCRASSTSARVTIAPRRDRSLP